MGIQGIIRPPPEIRAVADKTATFVAKNGRDFETRILNSGKGKTPKFAFLHSSSPFHAYYQDRIEFYSNGGSAKEEEEKKKKEEEAAEKAKDDAQQQQGDGGDGDGDGDGGDEKKKDEKAGGAIVTTKIGESKKAARKAKSNVDPVAKALLAQRAKIKQMNEPSKSSTSKESDNNDNPNEDDNDNEIKNNNDNDSNEQKQNVTQMQPRKIYTTPLPPKGISPSQLEIIKLTAQFVALNGANRNNIFMRELKIQEWSNPIYGFLQPRHGHYAYFTQLVDIYRRILQRSVVLHERKVTKDNALGTGGGGGGGTATSLLAMNSIKKMVGMDSIDHAESTALELQEEIKSIEKMAGNPRTCLDYSAYQTEYDRYNEEKRQAELEKRMNEGGGNLLAGSSIVDWHDFVVVETIDFAVDEVVESLPPPPPPMPKEEETIEKPAEDADEDMEASSDDDDEKEAINVVPDYTPKVVSSKAKFASEARTHVIDPITGKSIPIADMSEHMRIQLLDPKWAAEKSRFMEKQKDSNLVGGDMIARNVNAFTKARGDLFASSAQELESQDEASKRRLDEANRLIRDQSVAPEPLAPAVQVVQNQMSPSNTRERPQLVLPDAKRVRTNETSRTPTTNAFQSSTMTHSLKQETLQEKQPPASSPPSNENDTETIQIKLSEADFAKSLDDPLVTLSIIVPNDDSYSSWNFNGQTLSISVDVMTKIKGLKVKLQPQLGDMPVNKMQFKSPDVGFLKDAASLAKLNLCNQSQPIELIPKVRGSRK